MLASSGEITPPWGVPATVSLEHALGHHPRLEPHADQLEHPPVRHPLGHQREQPLLVDLPKKSRMSDSDDELAALDEADPQPLHRLRSPTASAGTRTSRAGSPPRRSAPAPACAACWATRSRTVGMPSGRLPPSGFGMSTRLHRRGTVPACSEVAWSSPSIRSTPYVLHRPPGSSDPPRPPPDSRAPAPTPPTARHPCGYGHTGHGNAAPETAWPQPIACVEVVARSEMRHQPALAPPVRRARPAGVVGPGGPGHALALTLHPRRDQSRGPSLPARYAARRSSGTTTPSDSRCPPPDFTIGLYERSLPDEAGQTGLSCSGPDLAHVPLPVPRRDPAG